MQNVFLQKQLITNYMNNAIKLVCYKLHFTSPANSREAYHLIYIEADNRATWYWTRFLMFAVSRGRNRPRKWFTGFVPWNKCSRYQQREIERPTGGGGAQLERNGPVYTIDKSGNSYAINRLQAADCTGFLYLWLLPETQRDEVTGRNGKRRGGLGRRLRGQEACQLFLCIDMNINNRSLPTWGQACRRTQSAWQSSLLPLHINYIRYIDVCSASRASYKMITCGVRPSREEDHIFLSYTSFYLLLYKSA